MTRIPDPEIISCGVEVLPRVGWEREACPSLAGPRGEGAGRRAGARWREPLVPGPV